MLSKLMFEKVKVGDEIKDNWLKNYLSPLVIKSLRWFNEVFDIYRKSPFLLSVAVETCSANLPRRLVIGEFGRFFAFGEKGTPLKQMVFGFTAASKSSIK